MKSAIKIVMLLTIIIHVVGCGAVFNLNKPRLMDDRAIASAYGNHAIDVTYKYMVGNVLLALIPVAGWVAAPTGILIDLYGNYNYRITDQALYNAWEKEYLKELEQHRQQLLNAK